MTDLALSPSLDVSALNTAFGVHRRLHIPDVLTPDSAEALTVAMLAYDGWRVTVMAVASGSNCR